MSRIVIVGAGQAGGQVAAGLRQQGCKDEIVLFGDEPHLPYQRPLLSKQYLSSEQEEGRIFLRPQKFYQDHEISLRIAQRIDEINPASKTVTTDQGEKIDYQDLILATGSRPRRLNIPGSELQGLHYLRTLDDVNAIKADMQPGKKLVIIGGGYIGLEVASVAVTAGLNVTVVEAEDRILKRVATAEMSEFYHQLHNERGVRILLQSAVSSFEGEGHVRQVVCEGRKIEADLVIVGIGIIPNIELAESAGIECDNGIVTDDHCQTSVPHIYAIGDCSNHPNPIIGRRLRLESVPNAMDQAKVVAANIMGNDKTYSAVPWFWSDQYEYKLQMVGFSADADRQVIRGDKEARQFAILYLQDNYLVAVDAVNSAREFMAGRQLYGRRFDPERLADSTLEVKDGLISDS